MSPNPSIVLELPDYDITAGGINRMLKIVMELPHYDRTSGGTNDTVRMAKMFNPTMSVRFQNLNYGYPQLDVQWSVGIPDNTFPECDICITYSDTPYLEKLLHLPQVKKVYILMLSYGMNLARERSNIKTKGVHVLCSSQKLERLIRAEKVHVVRIGIGLDMDRMFVEGIKRSRYLAILYHDMESKKYNTAVKVADQLYRSGKIDGVISFGRSNGYQRAKKPQALVYHFENATPDEVRKVFNMCQCFLMPSISEGINLTPIEATLCGCPSVICDGAIGEVFFDKGNCFVVKGEDVSGMTAACLRILRNFNDYSESFRKNMESVTSEMTWPKVITKLTKTICR